MGGLMIIGLVFMGIGMFVQWRLKSKFTEYSQVGLMNGMSGAEIADKMLRDNGINDVRITQVDGSLTDHYNPADKTVNLSHDVYNGRHVAAAAVAAHECGHAVQHATAYAWLTMRSKMVPAVQIASTAMGFLSLALAFAFYSMPHLGNTLMLVFIILQSAITLFTIVTLPVEIDASKRAVVWLNSAGITYGSEHDDAKDALRWAAYTYIVSALGAIASLLYMILRYTGSRD